MDSQKMKALNELVRNEYPNIAGMVVLQNGQCQIEEYYHSFTSENRFHIFSITKSIVSLLISIALDRREIQSVDQKILDYFPEYPIRKGHELLKQVTLRHCLTMSVPYRFRFNPYTRYFTSDDWVSFSLNQIGGLGQLGEFRYAPIIGPDILTGILTRATGRSVLDYAQENLFQPLGIRVEKSLTFATKEEQMACNQTTTLSGWTMGPKGVNTAGWGLTLTPREMAAIGQCCLNDGQFQGRTLIPAAELKESTRKQIRWEKMGLDYGYLWWVINEHEHAFAALGDGGNALYVNPQKNCVVAIASTFVPRVKDRIDFIRDHIEPLLNE